MSVSAFSVACLLTQPTTSSSTNRQEKNATDKCDTPRLVEHDNGKILDKLIKMSLDTSLGILVQIVASSDIGSAWSG